MEKLIFECETITPMFLGGAEGITPELRPPTIKAAMRFWWRVCNGNLSIEDLRKKEADLFGGSGEKDGRSKFDIRVCFNNLKIDKEIIYNGIAKNPVWYTESVSLKKNIVVNPIEYLGYGAYNFKDKWKKFIAPETKFSVIFKFYDNEIRNNLIKIFSFLTSFGALGSKSRNGFGQFRLLKENYLSIKELKSSLIPSSFSHLSKEVRIFYLKKTDYDSWQETMAKLGEIYRNGKLETDGAKHQYGKRKFIAAPVRNDVFQRKTKPYFFNVWKIKQNEKFIYQGFILYMPYFEIIQDEEIYTSGYNIEYPNKLKGACDKFNEEILKFNDLIEEVIL